MIVLRNPLYFVFLILMGVGAYVTYTLNLWGPILRMTNAASSQGLDIFKEKLRDFLETTDTGRQAVGMSAKGSYSMDSLNSNGTTKTKASAQDDVDDVDEI